MIWGTFLRTPSSTAVLYSLCCAVALFLTEGAALRAQSISNPSAKDRSEKDQGERKPVLVHYMAWYQSEPVSGHWGWHWTMDHFDPDQRGPEGKQAIASHQYPVIGPYDSSDEDLLEYHVQLMKFAGIDGVIVDWYGTNDFRDYRSIHQNTVKLLGVLERAGLKFAICYEDQAVKHQVAAERKTEEEGVTLGQQHLEFLRREWFSRSSYVRVDNRPVLLVFGPQYFPKATWTKLRESGEPRPWLIGLPHLTQKGMDSNFGWPPVSGGVTVSRQSWLGYLERLETERPDGQPFVGVAFPGYHDIYAEAELHESYGAIDANEGRTFQETLQRGLHDSSSFLQIATWNDFGEGTVIEPTQQLGTRYLEELIRQRPPALPIKTSDLSIPMRVYEWRKSHADTSSQDQLDQINDAIFAGDLVRARKLVDTFETSLTK